MFIKAEAVIRINIVSVFYKVEPKKLNQLSTSSAIQSTLVISTSIILNNRLSRR